jgi:hypothetical protein
VTDQKPTALDAAFVIGSTWVGSRMLARALGISPAWGTRLTVSAAVISATGAGGETAQRFAAAMFSPANRARLALENVELPARLLSTGEPDDAE